MYSILVFIHVISAFLLGSFLILPLMYKSLAKRAGDELKASLKTIHHYTRFGHYALILLFISGGWMVIGYSSYPSMLWVLLSLTLLLLIGAVIGMISKRLKTITHAENAEKALQENISKLKTFGWLTFTLVIIAAFIMTNRHLFL
ncbi:DUF2269 family protein [Oceanobacillus sp. FSL K6-0127]|uniref:DUF2269 family protein n=1 Tax=Oceanobacillus sp. FSL K6-0127 TaxID=2921420 RepID=UPI0030EDFF72